jgi:hypothetical protein
LSWFESMRGSQLIINNLQQIAKPAEGRLCLLFTALQLMRTECSLRLHANGRRNLLPRYQRASPLRMARPPSLERFDRPRSPPTNCRLNVVEEIDKLKTSGGRQGDRARKASQLFNQIRNAPGRRVIVRAADPETSIEIAPTPFPKSNRLS